jgi:outer membrane protein OmpA-like peptidoglycan-associated protein
MRRPLLSLLFPIVAVLTACGTQPVSTRPAAPSPEPAPRQQQPTLAAEQRRFAALFDGTPVVFAMQPDGSLRATVPRRYCFDAGSIKVQPPLAAVLDRLAKSQAPTASRLRISAPSDPQQRGLALARDRALSVRDYLMGHGIAAPRLQANGANPADEVEIVVIGDDPR